MDYFNSPEYRRELQLLDLSYLTVEIANYNKRFSLGALAAQHLKQLDDDEGNTEESAERRHSDRKRTSVEDIKAKYGILLEKAGLDLEVFGGDGVIFTGGDEVDSSQLRLKLADGKTFSEYLNALDPETITPTQIQGIIHVSTSMTQHLAQAVGVDQKGGA